jgi:hypothetical protein
MGAQVSPPNQKEIDVGIELPEQEIIDSTDRTDIYIWWLSQDECEAIGDFPPGSVPLYIRNEYRSRLGRPGRGRLWVGLEVGEVGIPWDDSKPAARLAGKRGGIVIYKTDATHVFGLPGFLTDLHLNFINSLQD